MIKNTFLRKAVMMLFAAFVMTQTLCQIPASAAGDSSWETVGTAGFSASGGWGAYNTKIALDGNDVPYVIYSDDVNDAKATVMKLDGTDWVTVGDPGFSEGYAGYPDIAFDSSDVPYVVFEDDGIDGKVTVMKFNGASWVTVGAAGFTSESAMYTSIALDSNDTPYVVFSDCDHDYGSTVMKYNGTNWVTVGGAGISAGHANFNSIAIDGNDTPYIVYKDWGLEEKASVKRFNGTGWESVGGAACTENQAGYTTIAVDSTDTLFISFRDGAQATVMTYNGTDWVTVGDAGFSEGDVSYPSISISDDDILYVGYVDESDASTDQWKATVMKYDGTGWTAVGDTCFSEGRAGYTSTAADSAGNPYVAFRDYANGYRATVMRYVASSGVDAETPTIDRQPDSGGYIGVWVGNTAVLFVGASVTTGTLSYQWYSNTTDSNINGTVIDGATENSYSVPTSAAGTTYYYCVVTNTDETVTGSTTATAVSNVAEVIVVARGMAITTASLPDGTVNESYSTTLTAEGGTEPYTWNTSGLPSGLEINTGTGEIYGVPVSSGTYSIGLSVRDGADNSDSISLDLTIKAPSGPSGGWSVEPLRIDSTDLPDGTAGEYYEQTLSAVGGIKPYTWSSAGLPEGLFLHADGIIFGTPDCEGGAEIVFEVTDSRNISTSKTLTLHIGSCGSPAFLLTDISGHWAEDDIQEAFGQGIIGGYPDRTFLPDREITRAEFVAMLVRAFGFEPKDGPGFADGSEHWAWGEIRTAAYYGFADGYVDGTFGPDAFMTREEMAVMIAEAMELAWAGGEAGFADGDSISSWARTSVMAALERGLINGYADNTFRPLDYSTRAEAVTVILNALRGGG